MRSCFQTGLVLLLGIPLIASSAIAQSDGTSPPPERPRVEVQVGWLSKVLPVGHRPALSMRVQLIHPPERKLRWVGGIEYSRQLGTEGGCCGPEPGYTYQEEAARVGVGGEITLLRAGDRSLSFDGRYQPTWYHTIRRGSQPDFEPPPTEWRLDPWLASFGVTGRRPLTGRMHASLEARMHVNMEALLWGAFSPAYAVSVGIGW